MNQQERYNEVIRQRKLRSMGIENTPDDTVDLSGPIGESAAKTDWLGNSNLTQNDNVEGLGAGSSSTSSPGIGAAAAGKTLAEGGKPEDAISQGLIMSGNPYAMGAGMALQTASAIKKGQNQRNQQRYLAEVEKANARQTAINKMAQIGQGLKA